MVFFQVQDKKLKFRMKKSELQSDSLDCYLIALDRCSIAIQLVKSRISSKISKLKRHITCPFEAQTTIPFFPVFKRHYKLTLGLVFKERIVHLVPLIVDLEFLYLELSQVFYRQYSLKKHKI